MFRRKKIQNVPKSRTWICCLLSTKSSGLQRCVSRPSSGHSHVTDLPSSPALAGWMPSLLCPSGAVYLGLHGGICIYHAQASHVVIPKKYRITAIHVAFTWFGVLQVIWRYFIVYGRRCGGHRRALSHLSQGTWASEHSSQEGLPSSQDTDGCVHTLPLGRMSEIVCSHHDLL